MLPSQPADVLVRATQSHRRLQFCRTPAMRIDDPSDKDLQRADGCGRIVLSSSESGTRIENLFERSPIRVMFPGTKHGGVKEAVLINTAGGVAGGDRLECSVAALADV